jgi:hypothetical protein
MVFASTACGSAPVEAWCIFIALILWFVIGLDEQILMPFFAHVYIFIFYRYALRNQKDIKVRKDQIWCRGSTKSAPALRTSRSAA